LQTFILVDENSVEPLIAELQETEAKFAGGVNGGSGGGVNGGNGGSRLRVEADHETVARRLIHTAREAGHICTAACRHD
jgi:hypothetical protein